MRYSRFGMRFSSRGDIAASQSTASIGVLNELTGGRESDTALCSAACALADSTSYFCAPA